jgi:hypothetical protein
MTTNLEHLKALAIAAGAGTIKGSWESTGVVIAALDQGGMEYLLETLVGENHPVLAFVEAFDPNTALKLLERLGAQSAPDFWVSVQHGEPKIDYMDRSDPAYKWFPVYRRPVSAQQGAAVVSPIYQARMSWPEGGGWADVDKAKYDELGRISGYAVRVVYESPTIAAKAPAAQADDLRLAICNIPLPVYGSNSFQQGFVSAKEAVLDLLSKRAASPASTPEAAPAAHADFESWWNTPNPKTGHPPSAILDSYSARNAWEAAHAQQPAAPVAYVNGDELDNMLDDRTATIQSNPSGWRRTPLYRAAPTAGEDVRDAIEHLPRYREWSGEGGGVYEDQDDGEYVKLDDVRAAMRATQQEGGKCE